VQRVCEPKGSAQSGQNFRKRGGQNLRNPQPTLDLAYRDYFATDRLMFQVPQIDARLKNKAEVLVMLLSRVSGTTRDRVPVAIAADFLKRHPLYHTEVASRHLVIVTSAGSANRVYEAGTTRFGRRLGDRLADSSGRPWRIAEDGLYLADNPTRRLPRVAAHRAFWFGWYAQFPGDHAHQVKCPFSTEPGDGSRSRPGRGNERPRATPT